MTPDVVTVALDDIRGLLAAAIKLRNDPINATVGDRIDASVVRPLQALLAERESVDGGCADIVGATRGT